MTQKGGKPKNILKIFEATSIVVSPEGQKKIAAQEIGLDPASMHTLKLLKVQQQIEEKDSCPKNIVQMISEAMYDVKMFINRNPIETEETREAFESHLTLLRTACALAIVAYNRGRIQIKELDDLAEIAKESVENEKPEEGPLYRTALEFGQKLKIKAQSFTLPAKDAADLQSHPSLGLES